MDRLVTGRRSPGLLRLRAGEWVEVLSKDEILATLDERGQLDGLPFMPQLFEFCGKRLRVSKRAHKSCDTIYSTGGLRLRDAVHLEGTNCDGRAYGGCGASCPIFWKEAWLKRADGDTVNRVAVAAPGEHRRCTEQMVEAATRAKGWQADAPRYACQATELLGATEHLPWWDLRQYAEDYTSGNVSLQDLMGGLGYVISKTLINRVGYRFGIRPQLMDLYDRVQKWRGGVPFPRRVGRVPPGQKTPLIQLGLKPGDRARVKSYDQILDTLDQNNKTRGMLFDAEEVPYCGRTMVVRSRTDKIVDECTGRIIPIQSGGAVLLEGGCCPGWYSYRRMFCPRGVFTFWRESWLERVD